MSTTARPTWPWSFRSRPLERKSSKTAPPCAQDQPSSLHVRYFSLHKGDFEVLVNVDLFRAEIHDFVRLAESGHDVVYTLPQLNGLGLLGSLSLALILAIAIAALRIVA